MLKISTYDFRDNLASYLSAVAKDKTPLLIEKYNRPLALVIPYDSKLVDNNFSRFFGFLASKRSTSVFNRRSLKEKRYVDQLRRS